MSLSEFSLIARYFGGQANRADVELGVGDDCALLNVPDGMSLAVSIDTMVAGVHFPLHTTARDIGHKLMAVNLSDLAAMGAVPAWATLALTLPQSDESWLDGFCAGLFGLAERYEVQVVGGDTTRGPMTLSLQVHGFVPRGQALRRAGARPGDLIFVTGTLGDGGLGLRCAQGQLDLSPVYRDFVLKRLNRPLPSIEAGIALRGIATSAIDISDGLLADLGHILQASGVGATVERARVPLSEAYQQVFDEVGGADLALTAGDDYELCFTVPPGARAKMEQALGAVGCPVTHIGHINAECGLHVLGADGAEQRPIATGYDHFRLS